MNDAVPAVHVAVPVLDALLQARADLNDLIGRLAMVRSPYDPGDDTGGAISRWLGVSYETVAPLLDAIADADRGPARDAAVAELLALAVRT